MDGDLRGDPKGKLKEMRHRPTALYIPCSNLTAATFPPRHALVLSSAAQRPRASSRLRRDDVKRFESCRRQSARPPAIGRISTCVRSTTSGCGERAPLTTSRVRLLNWALVAIRLARGLYCFGCASSHSSISITKKAKPITRLVSTYSDVIVRQSQHRLCSSPTKMRRGSSQARSEPTVTDIAAPGCEISPAAYHTVRVQLLNPEPESKNAFPPGVACDQSHKLAFQTRRCLLVRMPLSPSYTCGYDVRTTFSGPTYCIFLRHASCSIIVLVLLLTVCTYVQVLRSSLKPSFPLGVTFCPGRGIKHSCPPKKDIECVLRRALDDTYDRASLINTHKLK